MKKLLVLIGASIILLPMLAGAAITGDTIDYSIEGKITYKSGTVVKIQKTSSDEMPGIGIEGVLSKYFETELFGGKMSGWMSIGKMKITVVAKDIITFTLLKEMSEITENGVKKNQFEIGKVVKFEWKVPVAADEAAYKKGQDVLDDDEKEAMKYYKEAVSLNPNHDKALNMIGILMNGEKNYDSAYYYFKLAYDLKPNLVTYCKNLCIVNYRLGLTQDAYDYATKATVSDKENAEAWYLKALMQYFIKKDIITDIDKQGILADVDKAVLLAADNSFYRSERAFLRNEFGNAAGACEDAKKAKELGSEEGDELVSKYCK